ncbi:hypothetical protein PFUGPA_00802 [Plasmodium falciparum Palo Alto/Uganda]|uniref:Leucine-rich repeat protein n=1 Tax=Plasmodium falciparum (isolate Palo Alto / Uganda) TaxID=57270 RepID=W4J4V3_PLAFP|nr:hypothetical protein PFUGPA_00802 [Plasmodium falciparum Palo Alto/Uganda]
MNIKSKFQKLKLENDVIYSSNLIINEDDIADFVSTLNIQKKNINDENCSTHNLSTVKVIHLSSLKINDWGLSILIPCILRSRKLTTLNLSNNCLTNDSANILSKCLKYLPHLRCLNLSNNLIKCQGAINIIEEFFQDNIKENSTSLNIYHVDNLEENILTNNNKINQNKYLQEIDISDNFLGTNFIIKLSDILHKKKDKKKYKIVLKNVGINNTDICYFLPKCKDVEILNISENKIMFENFPKYIEILFDDDDNICKNNIMNDNPNGCYNNFNNVYNIITSQNRIFTNLIKNLYKAKNLRILCLSNNNINDDNFKTFCLHIQHNKDNKIEEIDFSYNRITDLNPLNECLKNNHTLKIINLSNNHITDEKIKTFCYENLSENLNICELSLAYNKLSNNSCIYISDALINQANLIKTTLKETYEFIKQNSSLTQEDLDMYINKMSDKKGDIDNEKFGDNKKEDEDISNINIFKDIIINRHNEENNFFSCIGISNFYRATDLSKNLYLQETRRNCIYKINEEFNKLYNSNNIFSANCLKGLKFLNLSSCNINNDGISYLLKSLKTSLCTLEYLDISCCQDLSNNTYQEFTNLISYKKYKFLKTNHFVFKNLPLTVRGIPPMLIPLYDSEDNTDGNSTESDWWNYKKED